MKKPRVIRKAIALKRLWKAKSNSLKPREIDEARVIAAGAKLGLTKLDLMRLGSSTPAGNDYRGYNPELLVMGLKEANRRIRARKKN